MTVITITIITKNEETNLNRLLPILTSYKNRPDSLVSEIVILDSLSTDGSKALAAAHGVQWQEERFEGYGKQKNRVTELASNDWVLNLDADEVPSEDFWRGLKRFFDERSGGVYAATLSRDFVLFGKRLRFGGASEQRKIRLFHRQYFSWDESPVHEDVIPLSDEYKEVGSVEGIVLHYSWRSIHNCIDIMNERAYVGARLKLQKNTSLSMLKLQVMTRFFLDFVRSYFFRLGLLDGVAGFVFCFLMAFSQAAKYMQAYEMVISSKNS